MFIGSFVERNFGEKNHLKWVVSAVFFLMWSAVYTTIFIFAAVLFSDLDIVGSLQCISSGCINAECSGVAWTMMIVGITGMVLWCCLAALSLSLRHIFLKTQEDTKEQVDGQQDSQVRKRRGGVDNTAPAPNTVHQTPHCLDGPEGENQSTDHTACDIEMTRLGTTEEENTSVNEEETTSVSDAVHDSKSQVPGETHNQRPPYKPFSHWAVCASLCAKCYLDPTEFEFKFGPNNKFDSYCCVQWSTVMAQCCFFPWFISIFT
mmetsp:Transcript_12987/g.23409  ORF Transcript_12987/g.23409 Transcript_12987/m.23409 type:complete len:262 (+) Transcript_12987:91-876(+)